MNEGKFQILKKQPVIPGMNSHLHQEAPLDHSVQDRVWTLIVSSIVRLTIGHHTFVFGLLACCLSPPIASKLVRATPKFTAEIPRIWRSPSRLWLLQAHLLSELMEKQGPCCARGDGSKEMLMKMLSPCAKALEGKTGD